MIDTYTMTLADFIAAEGLTFHTEPTQSNPYMPNADPKSFHWYYIIYNRHDQKMIVHYTMGSAHRYALRGNSMDWNIHERHYPEAPRAGLAGKPIPPTLADVLDCLASDAAGYGASNGFEEWANEYGYDTDSRKAERTYHAVQSQARSLERLLGREAYERLLWKVERQ